MTRRRLYDRLWLVEVGGIAIWHSVPCGTATIQVALRQDSCDIPVPNAKTSVPPLWLRRPQRCGPSVPVQPLLLASQQEYGMFEHFRRYPWVLKPFLYRSPKGLLADLAKKVIAPAEAKV